MVNITENNELSTCGLRLIVNANGSNPHLESSITGKFDDSKIHAINASAEIDTFFKASPLTINNKNMSITRKTLKDVFGY